MGPTSFLSDLEILDLDLPGAGELKAEGLVLGKGDQPVEIAVFSADHRPSTPALRTAWKARLKGRATPLVVVALYNGRAALCGPNGDQPHAYGELTVERVERICRAAVEEPDRHSALRFLQTIIPKIESTLPGLRNAGLFATHELERGLPSRKDWSNAVARSIPALPKRNPAVLEAIGFTIEPLAGPAAILRRAGTKTAIAVLLERNEPPDVTSTRFSGQSPVSYALSKADDENLPWVVVCSGPMLRLYPVKPGVGTGQRGRTETFTEIRLDLLDNDNAGYLWLLFSADALKEGGTVQEILNDSARYAADLGQRLRDRIYAEVIPPLAERMMLARGIKKPTAGDLAETYQMALTLLFRLLFVAYAEDKELLPYHSNEAYRHRSLKDKALELREIVVKHGVSEVDAGAPFDSGFAQWEEVERLFDAVNNGNKEWGVPKYNGGLFSTDPGVSKIGAQLSEVRINNKGFAPILSKLLLDQTPEGPGPVDFRSLGVREFGTIYEGLLENELSIAEDDLTIGKNGDYKPAGKKDEVVVQTGRPYLHNKSGARKASGSYFTKSFAVEHLLDHALELALVDHLTRLDALSDDRARADAFFDFRVADIAMGSGHFLIAAIDRIERAFSHYLSNHPLTDVAAELARLRNSAHDTLGPLGESVEIEDMQLLRRQIARRCIYGVDLNQIAVELARLSVWIHTFVPGLPLSFLDHNLIAGNSLVGIATIEEAREWLKEVAGSLFALSAEGLVGSAWAAIEKLARVSDANAQEITAARKAFAETRKAVAPAEALFNILAAARIDDRIRGEMAREASQWVKAPAKLVDSAIQKRAEKALQAIPPTHFPVVFPEVFLRERSGFDVILGNPPWEEATVEEDRFWMRYEPGFHSLAQDQRAKVRSRLEKERPDVANIYQQELEQAELLRNVLTAGPFPGMGTGDPDVYKAFAWRFWNLVSHAGGRMGVVLPRVAFAARGSTEFRRAIMTQGLVEDITQLLNNRSWVFEDVHPQYTIALTSIKRLETGSGEHVCLRGPFRSEAAYVAGVRRPSAQLKISEVMTWTDSASLPLLPNENSPEVFLQLRNAPRLDFDDGKSWLARAYAELHATNDKKLMKFSPNQPDGFWPVFQGRSFDIWVNDTGTYYAWADPEKVKPVLQRKRMNSAKAADSPFHGFSLPYLRDEKTLGCNSARIAFRDVARATDSRTVRAALVSPKIFLTNKGPYFLWPRGDENDQAYLLGVLCSLPLDWYARRFVEVNLNYHILNPFPVPRPDRKDPLWRRVVHVAGRLASQDKRLRKWANLVGVECGSLKEDEKDDMIYELDAVVGHLYGLSEPQLTHIFETFHEGWDCEERLKNTLGHFRNWGDKL